MWDTGLVAEKTINLCAPTGLPILHLRKQHSLYQSTNYEKTILYINNTSLVIFVH